MLQFFQLTTQPLISRIFESLFPTVAQYNLMLPFATLTLKPEGSSPVSFRRSVTTFV